MYAVAGMPGQPWLMQVFASVSTLLYAFEETKMTILFFLGRSKSKRKDLGSGTPNGFAQRFVVAFQRGNDMDDDR